MMFGDLSGQINGLIIFSNLSFAITLFTQARQREDKKLIQDMIQTLENIINKSQTLYENQEISGRYDLLTAKKLGIFNIEVFLLLAIIFSICALRVIEATCNSIGSWSVSFNNVGTYGRIHEIVLHSVTALSFLFLLWITYTGIHVGFVRTATHRHDAAVRRFHSDLKVIDSSIDDKIDSAPRFRVLR